MATTIQQIAQFLDQRNWKYHLDEEKNRIVTAVVAENVENFLLLFDLTENGEYLQIVAPQLLAGVKNHVYKGVLFQTLLALGWETKMVRWEYNLLNGEVRAAVEIPIEDGVLTQQQFDRILYSLIHVVDEIAMPRLLAVLQTGEDPGEKQLGERLLLAVQEMLPDGSLSLLEKALHDRKQRGVS